MLPGCFATLAGPLLVLTRLAAGKRSHTRLNVPNLAPA